MARQLDSITLEHVCAIINTIARAHTTHRSLHPRGVLHCMVCGVLSAETHMPSTHAVATTSSAVRPYLSAGPSFLPAADEAARTATRTDALRSIMPAANLQIELVRTVNSPSPLNQTEISCVSDCCIQCCPRSVVTATTSGVSLLPISGTADKNSLGILQFGLMIGWLAD